MRGPSAATMIVEPMTRHRLALLAVLAALPAPRLGAQDTVPPERLAARAWYQDAKFGMFIHWGASSVLMDGEWVMNNRQIRVAEYERIAPLFNPVAFNAAEWVATAKRAGMKYLVLISKHHDGFALWHSVVSDWNVVDRTPWKQDVVKLLSAECAKQGLRFFVYYSQLDWHHPDYFPRGQTGRTAGRPEAGEWSRYLDFMDAELTELLTGYGPIGGIWFDGMWDKPEADWRLERTYRLIHTLQPATLIIPNHHQAPLPGEDVQTFEKDLPGANTAGFNTTSVGALPLETSETMNDSWGFRLTDRNFKSPATLIRELVNAAGRNANFLLNVGPMPDGRIQPEFVANLAAIGAWMTAHGESIYGTRGGPIPPRPWGVSTWKGNRVYLHLLDWSDRTLALPPFPRAVKSAALMDGGAAVLVRQTAEGVTLVLPAGARDPVDLIVVLELGN